MDKRLRPRVIKFMKCVSGIIEKFETFSNEDICFVHDIYKHCMRKGYKYLNPDHLEIVKNRTYIVQWGSDQLKFIRYTDHGEVYCGVVKLNRA